MQYKKNVLLTYWVNAAHEAANLSTWIRWNGNPRIIDHWK